MAERHGGERDRLQALERAVAARARDLALFLTYDRPSRVEERPGIARAFFAQRCVSDQQLDQMVDAFRSVGSYVELFDGEGPLLAALASGHVQRVERSLKVLYNGIEGGIAHDGFEPGRKALIPAIADSYGLICSNSNAYACALGRHKFHYFTLLRALGVPTPRVWHYRLDSAWAGNRAPELGTKVIAKSTYESWSVGVTEESIFIVDETCDDRVSAIAHEIGQAVTVQEFVSGPEVCVPVFSAPGRFATPPVEAILAKAPGDPNAVMTIDDNLNHAGVTYRSFIAPTEVGDRLTRAALGAFNVLELEAFARIDFRVDDGGGVWVIDVGVSPGLSTASSAFSSLTDLGFSHAEFLRIVVGATLAANGVL